MKIVQKIGLLLRITQKRLFNNYEVRYLLDDIDPRWETVTRFSVRTAVTALVSLVFAGWLWWYGKTYLSPPEDGGYLFMSVVCSVIFLIAGFRAVRSHVNLVLFNGKNGNRLFSLYGKRPNAAEVNAFCEYVAKRIDEIRYQGGIAKERMGEILARHVEFLVEQGVLSQAEADSAMKRIKEKVSAPVVTLVGDRHS